MNQNLDGVGIMSFSNVPARPSGRSLRFPDLIIPPACPTPS